MDLPVEGVVVGLAKALRLEHGVVVCDVEDLVDGLLDEDEGDEAGKVLLGEPRDVAHEGASVEGDQAEHDNAHPDAGPAWVGGIQLSFVRFHVSDFYTLEPTSILQIYF